METELITMIAAIATLGVAIVAVILAWQTSKLLESIKGWMKMTGMASYLELAKFDHEVERARQILEKKE